jgi:hypothetical protein
VFGYAELSSSGGLSWDRVHSSPRVSTNGNRYSERFAMEMQLLQRLFRSSCSIHTSILAVDCQVIPAAVYGLCHIPNFIKKGLRSDSGQGFKFHEYGRCTPQTSSFLLFTVSLLFLSVHDRYPQRKGTTR